MTSRDFAYWLQGFFEITEAGQENKAASLSEKQVDIIKRHLSLVFIHEINPLDG